MAGKFFIGNSNNIATLPKDILVGDSNNIARKVKGIYVGNSQNKAVKVWPNGRVPEGYQEVEYIKSVYNCNGFETGIVPNSNTRIIITFMFSKIDLAEFTHNQHIGLGWATIAAPFHVPYNDVYQLKTGFSSGLRAYNQTTTSLNYFFCTGFGNDTYFLFNEIKTTYSTPTEADVNFVNEQLLNKKITIDLNRSRGTLYYNDKLKKTFVNTFSDLKTDICLLSYNIGYKPSSLSVQSTQNQINLYSCQIYKNDVLVRNFIPCYRKTDNEPLLYDTVSESFFRSGNPSHPPYLGPDV